MDPEDSNNNTSDTFLSCMTYRKGKCLFEKEDEAPKLKTAARTTTTTTTTHHSFLEKYAKNLSAKDARLLVNVLEGKEEKKESFPDDTTEGGLEEFRKVLLQIVVNNLPMEAITPGIITHLGHNTDLLFDQVENDETFILLALTTMINTKFFLNAMVLEPTDYGQITFDFMLNLYGVFDLETNTEEGPKPELATNDDKKLVKEDLVKDFLKIKTRWIILDKVIEFLFNKSAGTDALINRLINIAGYCIRKGLLDRMLNSVSRYSKSSEYYIAIGRDEPTLVEPLDASFSVSMINTTNYKKVTNLVEKNLITFFGSSVKCPNQFHLNCSRTIKEEEEKEERHYCRRKYLEPKNRRLVWKSFTLKTIIIKTLEAFAHSKDDDEVVKEQQIISEMRRIFDELVYRLNEQESFNLIKYWDVPSPVLLRVFNNTLAEIKRRGILSLDLNTSCFSSRWYNNRFGWLVERIIEKEGLDIIPKNEMDYVIDVMLKLENSYSFCSIFEKYKDKLTVKRIKEIAYFAVTEVNGYSSTLEFLLEKFPWLLNTWLDYEGNTLLCLCVRFNYKYLDNLLALDIVKKHINVESMDGCNPLFVAADHPKRSFEFRRLWEVGGADLIHVNRHHESVFHRLAASNNSKCLRQLNDSQLVKEKTKPILELRRKRDAATALMVALAREHVDAASVLMNFGSLATTMFGHSKTLRTVEVLFLMEKKLSIALLDQVGIKPMISIIAKSFKEKALFKEECFIPMTGIENNGKVDAVNVYKTGSVSERLEFIVDEKERGYVGRRIFQESRSRRCNNSDPSSLNLKDFTWSLFEEKLGFSRLEWVRLLLNNKEEELKKIIVESNKEFENKTCADCGHSLHDACWKRLCGSNIKCSSSYKCCRCKMEQNIILCPSCRKPTFSFHFMDSLDFSPEPNAVIPKPPPTTVRHFKRKHQNTIEDDEKYQKVVRYEFLINRKWVDESSQLNTLLA